MICKTCGVELRDGVRMCPICGTQQVEVPPKPRQTQPAKLVLTKQRIISLLFVLLFIAVALWRIIVLAMRKKVSRREQSTGYFLFTVHIVVITQYERIIYPGNSFLFSFP